MRVMAAAVLTMESLLMGFALLLAKDSASNAQPLAGNNSGNFTFVVCWSIKAQRWVSAGKYFADFSNQLWPSHLAHVLHGRLIRTFMDHSHCTWSQG